MQFIGPDEDHIKIESLGNGLIHHTYRACHKERGKAVVLQSINTHVFKNPEDILHNYREVYQYLQQQQNGIHIPPPVYTSKGQLLWLDEENHYWRATGFIDRSYSPLVATTEDAAYTVAKSFAEFTRSLAGLDTKNLKEIIPGFHDLSLRYHQFEDAIAGAPVERLLQSTHIIAELRQRKKLVDFYESIRHSPGYPDRVMHHDCKISNILFDGMTGDVICPVDLDTTMPGKFFSDIGDMIRSMACTVDENSIRWEDIDIRPSFYKAILKGYLEGIGDIFTAEEKKHIHYAGPVMIYMQSVRFLSDYLNNDRYYKIVYPEQNLNRALNQLILLEKLEAFLKAEYAFVLY